MKYIETLYHTGSNIMFTLNEEKYVGTLMRDHNKYHQALLLVGVFNMKTLLFDNVFDIDKKKAKLEKKSKKGIYLQIINCQRCREDDNKQLHFYTCE